MSRRFLAVYISHGGGPWPFVETPLVEWAEAPAARECHQREEHLLPLHVMTRAGYDDEASLPLRCEMLGVRVSSVQFGGVLRRDP